MIPSRWKYHEYIDEWLNLVERGKVRACKEQKQLMKLVKKELSREDVCVDSEAIYEAVEIVEKYFPFKLIAFQKFFYAFVTGVFLKDGTLLFDEYFFYSGRGTGKNGLISTLVFYLSSDKNGVRNYNIDIVATSEKQSSTSFFEVYDVIDATPKLQRLFDYNKTEITYKRTKSKIRYCTSNSKTHDGGRPGAIIFDEVHEFVNYDNITVHTGGLGKIEKPRTFYITTDGYVREAVLDDLKEKAKRILEGEDHHNGFFPFMFKMDKKSEVDDPDLWEKANPRINHDVTLKKTVLKQYKDMGMSSELKSAFYTKRMNLPLENIAKAVAEWEEIKDTNQPFPNFQGCECIGAVDYADLKDFCSVGLLFKREGKRYFMQHTFIHEKSLMHTKFNVDIMEAVDLGLATVVKNTEIIDGDIVANWFVQNSQKYAIKKVVADRYRYSALKEEFEKVGFVLTQIGTGYITHNKLHPLITKLFANRNIVFGNDKLMRWYTNNCYVDTDGKGNKSYKKIEPIKRKTDGFFAFIHAMSADEELVDSENFRSLEVRTY